MQVKEQNMQLDEALDKLEAAGYSVIKNKYNFVPKSSKLSFKQCTKISMKNHKRALDYLKDK